MHLSISSIVLGLFSSTAAKFAATPISQLRHDEEPALTKRDVKSSTLYPAYHLSVPIDHFVSPLTLRSNDPHFITDRYSTTTPNMRLIRMARSISDISSTHSITSQADL